LNKSSSKLTSGPEYALCLLVHQACAIVEVACWAKLKEYGLSPTAAMVLYLIQSIGGEAGPNELSRLLFRRPHSVYELLNRMEKAGVVRKFMRPKTKRKGAIRFELTEKGLQLYNISLSYQSSVELRSNLSEQEMRRLKSYIKRLISQFDNKTLMDIQTSLK